MSLRLSHTFSSVQCFTLRSLSNLELNFVQSYKFGSIWILLHAVIHFAQNHLLKCFPVCISGFNKIRCPLVYEVLSLSSNQIPDLVNSDLYM